MCGIAGFVEGSSTASPFGPDTSRALVHRMCDVIRHRGPDDEGIWLDDAVALGMRRLSIIDLSTGHQPIHNEDRSVWIVFNGEIYNFQELRRELEAAGHRFYTSTDTEAIVHAYEQWGAAAIGRLRGMFGLAIWDTRSKSLLVARDRIGIKPMYYADANGRLYFGSELKSLLAAPDMEGEGAEADGLARRLGRPRLGRALEDVADAQQQFARLERLGQIVVGADLQPPDPVGGMALGGQHQDGDVGGGPDRLGEIEAVLAGHHHVEDQAIEIDAFDERTRLGRVRRRGDAESARREIALQQATQPRIVVDDKEMRVVGCVHRQRIAAGNRTLTGFSSVMLTSLGCRFRRSKREAGASLAGKVPGFRGFSWPK